MLFNSFHFAIFCPVVLAVTTLLGKRVAFRNLFLAIASYYFYACWDWRFLSLIVISTIVDYACGRLLEHDPQERRERPYARTILTFSVVTNLGILAVFKYFNFFVTSLEAMLQEVGIGLNTTTLNIVLPVGISFYTFQTMSYTIDVYRGHMKAQRDFLTFALFVCFFPQLVAGPIERASRLLPQLEEPWRPTWPDVSSGFYLCCAGLFKKVVIADNVAPIVDLLLAQSQPTASATLLGIFLFAIQIYCDFSGYSDMARGVARLMGVQLMLNFNLPYFATNPSEFWQRWHISLSSWLRDYLYIPLGGNRHGPSRTYVNLMVTMLLGGLWHGAAWTFVTWGAYHGLLLGLYRVAQPWLASWRTPTTWWVRVARRVGGMLVFFPLICGSWLLFRAESLEHVARMLSAIADCSYGFAEIGRQNLQVAMLLSGIFVAVQVLQFATGDLFVLMRLPVPMRATIYMAGILLFLMMGADSGNAFIYFQF